MEKFRLIVIRAGITILTSDKIDSKAKKLTKITSQYKRFSSPHIGTWGLRITGTKYKKGK